MKPVQLHKLKTRSALEFLQTINDIQDIHHKSYPRKMENLLANNWFLDLEILRNLQLSAFVYQVIIYLQIPY